MPNTFRFRNNNDNRGTRPANTTDEDLVPNDNNNQPIGPRSTTASGTSLLAAQSRNMDAFGNYSNFLNSNGNLTMETNEQRSPAIDGMANANRHETAGFWDFKEDDDYVPIEEQRILRTVPQFPGHTDKQLKDFNKLDNQGAQNLYGAQVGPCQSLYN